MIGPPVRPGPGTGICGTDRATTPCLRSDVFALVRGPMEIRSDGYARGVTATELGLPALRGAARRDPARPGRPPPRRHVRAGRDRPAHLPDRPLQPALHLLHARRGPRLDAARRAAHRRRARPAHHDRGPRPRRARAALHRRRAAAAPRARAHHRGLGGTSGRVRTSRSPPTASASPAAPRRWPRPGSTGSTSRSTPCAPTGSPRSPAATASPTCSRASPPPATAGLDPVKINTVLLRGVNDDEAVPLLRFAVEHGYELRFIEQMPLDAQHGWQRAEMVTAGEIMADAPRGDSRSRPTRPSAAAPRPSGGSSTAARRWSASSPR